MAARRSSSQTPTFEVERALAADAGREVAHVAGIDEVGRGALAGPVAVGVCVVRIAVGENAGAVPDLLPAGVRDSKSLSQARRERLAVEIEKQAAGCAVGWASAAEIDQVGIMKALTIAALRGIDEIATQLPGGIDAIVLDGSVDVLTTELARRGGRVPRVQCVVRADRDCASVAAASIVAKVQRDSLMRRLHEGTPEYGWAGNKGYGTAAHREAIARFGASVQHRTSWNLGKAKPGVLWDEHPAPSWKEPR